MKEFNFALETGKIFANQLGDTLAQAFTNGKFALDEFIKSLMIAIMKMMIMRAIMSMLGFAVGGPVGGAVAATGGGGGGVIPKYSPNSNMLNKQTTIRVEGNLRAESNEFIAGFNKAVNVYNRNVKGGSIGRQY